MNTVLITGSSRGIGLACARRFAREGGWHIVINSRTQSELSSAEATLSSYKDTSVSAFCGDVSDEAFVHSLFERLDRLDVLVNNAGIDRAGLLQDTSVEEWSEVMDINLRSAFLMIRGAIPLMLKTHSGSIVNVSSVWGTVGGACEAVYSASKGGMNALTRAMAQELAPSGIRVNAAAFGAIDTVMNARLNEEELCALADEIPLGRLGSAEEAADLLYGLAVRYTYMTGQIITMDGGWT